MFSSSNNKKFFAVLFTLALFSVVGCGHDNPNRLAEGQGTYDPANNPNAPGNEAKLVDDLSKMSANPIPMKAQMAIGRLERLGAVAEEAIPSLEKVAAEHESTDVKEAAQKAIDAIKADIAEKAGAE